MAEPTIGQAWRVLRDRFAAAGLPNCALDARLLTRHVLGLDETGLILAERDPISEHDHAALDALAARRLGREPVARILGVQEFYGLPFALNGATLVPRPETELLVDFGLAVLRERMAVRLLDLGTGTGCIALALLANLPDARGLDIDLAPQALAQARDNADRLGLADRFEARQGDWFGPLAAGEKFDLIVSNPPYIASPVLAGLAPEVLDHDPALALDGGPDGLAPYRVIAASAGAVLAPGGALALEIGFDQGAAVAALLVDAGLARVEVARDLAGHDRMVSGWAQK